MADELERATVARILAVLPDDHPARQALRAGADTVALTHLVADRPELVAALTDEILAAYRRINERAGSFRPHRKA